jgi:hypothetical protein
MGRAPAQPGAGQLAEDIRRGAPRNPEDVLRIVQQHEHAVVELDSLPGAPSGNLGRQGMGGSARQQPRQNGVSANTQQIQIRRNGHEFKLNGGISGAMMGAGSALVAHHTGGAAGPVLTTLGVLGVACTGSNFVQSVFGAVMGAGAVLVDHKIGGAVLGPVLTGIGAAGVLITGMQEKLTITLPNVVPGT